MTHRYLLRRSPRARVLLGLAAGLLGLLAPAGSRADAIVRTNGQRIENVKITTARWDQISYESGSAPLTLKGDQVMTIERQSPVIQRIRQPLEQGDFREALEAVKRYEGSVAGWEKAELEYLRGVVYLKGGAADRAEDAFKSYLDAHQDDRDFWVPHAIAGRGEAALALKRGQTAEGFFKDLEPFGDTWALRSVLGQAQGALIAKRWQQARQLFARVASDRNAPVSMQLEAKVGRIEVLVRQDQFAAAIRDLDESFFANPDPAELRYTEARARATLFMGIAYAKQSGQENLEKAEIWLLKTAVLYASYPAVRKEACEQLAEVYKGLGRADRAKEWASRAGG